MTIQDIQNSHLTSKRLQTSATMVSSASSSRETPYDTVSSCPFQEATIRPDADSSWQLIEGSSSEVPPDAVLPGIISTPGSSIRIPPSTRWSDESFQAEKLWLEGNFCCQWQAKARECVGLAVSPAAAYAAGMYEVCIGAVGNTCTKIRRHGRRRKQDTAQIITVPSWACQERAWTSYWVCFVVDTDATHTTKLYVGVGDIPGKQCMAIYQEQQKAVKREAVKQQDANMDEAMPEKGEAKHDNVVVKQEDDVGDHEDGIVKQEVDVVNQENNVVKHEEEGKEESMEPTRNVVHYLGFGNLAVRDRQNPVPLHVRNICLSSLPTELLTSLNALSPTDLDMIQVGVEDMDPECRKLVNDYQEQCRKARVRAAKFGMPYQPPPTKAFMSWSQERRLRANPQPGFQTGIDLHDPVEKAKQEMRMKRFGGVAVEKVEEQSEEGILPIVQAWDNEELVRSQRTDPPQSLWTSPSAELTEAVGEFETPPTLVHEKIHFFSIDWAAFKQMRTNDVMAYFSGFGPSYVEWLGDLSCNVLFEDQFSATRALENMSQELPVTIPDDVDRKEDTPNLGSMGWRFCKRLIRKVSTDRHGKKGTTARLLMRVATSRDILLERPSSWPKPPPGFTTKRVLGPGSDLPKQNKRRRDQKSADTSSSELLGAEPALMNLSLSSRRKGYTVDEMEAERAQKRLKSGDQ